MNELIKDKLQKVIALVNAGATDGEKQAANEALNRLIKKYNISPEIMANIELKKYAFSYKTEIDMNIFVQVAKILVGKRDGFYKDTWRTRKIECELTYEQWVTIDCAYEYFRRHAAAQWKKIALPELAKCRKAKTRNKKREQLQRIFLTNYLQRSGLVEATDLRAVTVNSEQDWKNQALMNGVEGGEFKKQVVTTNLLEA